MENILLFFVCLVSFLQVSCLQQTLLFETSNFHIWSYFSLLSLGPISGLRFKSSRGEFWEHFSTTGWGRHPAPKLSFWKSFYLEEGVISLTKFISDLSTIFGFSVKFQAENRKFIKIALCLKTALLHFSQSCSIIALLYYRFKQTNKTFLFLFS